MHAALVPHYEKYKDKIKYMCRFYTDECMNHFNFFHIDARLLS